MRNPSSSPTVMRGIWLIVAVVVAPVGALLLARLAQESAPNRVPQVMGSIQKGLTATERSGKAVSLSDLKGKVFTCAYLYTVCPHGCAAVMGQMKRLHEVHGMNPSFHQVSIAVVPERDSAATLTAYAEALGVGAGASWWFITGPLQPLVSFMTDDLRLRPCKVIPPDERLNPADTFEHDLRIVLVDRKGQVRGYYEVFHPQPEIAKLMCAKLDRDLNILLKHPEI